VDGVSFVITAGEKRLGLFTDLGHPFDGLTEVISSLDAVIIESNYDREMLESGPYPPHLKRRIRGSGGHLSNTEAAHLLHRAKRRLNWACLAHLSEMNNTKERVLHTHRQILGDDLPLFVASRYEVSGVLTV
jgi:phosphoribosyl 1,2-cyclic phosphodiesterase